MWSSLNNKAKALIIFSAFGLVSGSSILIHKISTAKTIKEIILSKSYTLLNSTNNTEWTQILSDYTEQVKNKQDLKLNNFEGGTGENKIKELQKECAKILEVKYRVALVKKLINKALWCVKEQKVSEYLKKNKFTLLKVISKDDESDKSKWDQKIKKYLSKENKEKIPDLNIEKSTNELINEDERKAFIEECEKLKELKHFSEKFINSYNLASTWCAEEPNDS